MQRAILFVFLGLAMAGPSVTQAKEKTKAGRVVAVPMTAKPAMPAPVYRGKHYEALVPDTLDLADRAALAIHALTCFNTGSPDWNVYGYAIFGRRPMVMSGGPGRNPKWWEALPLLRLTTGSSLNLEADKRWREQMLEMWSPDSPAAAPLRNPVGVGGPRALGTIAIYSVLDKDNSSIWRGLGNETVDRWADAATYIDDYAYYGEAWDGKTPAWGGTFYGWLLQALSQYYRATGYQPTLTFAGKLARYLKDRAGVFDGQGHFLAQESNTPPGYKPYKPRHFHHHTNALLGMAEYALASGDREFAEFAKRGYEYARSVGSPLVGFYPEYIDISPQMRLVVDCEGCCVADMLALGVKLTEAGVGDYWDDVDRAVRNQFAEMQITRADWLKRYAATTPRETPVQLGEDAADVPERIVGSFGGWTSANDIWVVFDQQGLMTCCNGNGSRALYYVWENIYSYKQGTLRVNLLLNRVSSWADIASHIPYQGRVEVQVKRDLTLLVRAPEWVKPGEVICQVNGRPRKVGWEGRYVRVGTIRKGGNVVLDFPILERTVKETIGQIPYTLVVKGNTVVSIDPPGKIIPFYQRAHYRSNVTRWVKKERFVSDHVFHW